MLKNDLKTTIKYRIYTRTLTHTHTSCHEFIKKFHRMLILLFSHINRILTLMVFDQMERHLLHQLFPTML